MTKNPVNVIFDMDVSADCTNIGALGALHALMDLGEVNLLTTTIGFNSPYVAGCTDAINQYYGRDIPVGILHSKEEPVKSRYFTDKMCDMVNSRYPAGAPVEDAVRIHRRALASAEDGSVTFIITGLLATAVALLDSGPDEFSPLNGKELVAAKIIRTIVMAGEFTETFGDESFCEFNISLDIPAARRFCEEWPCEVIFTGFEIGCRVPSLAEFIEYGDKDSPVRLAYELIRKHNHELFSKIRKNSNYPIPIQLELLREYNKGNINDPFPTWDSTASLLAARPEENYFCLHEHGRVVVAENGFTQWRKEKGGKQTYLMPNPEMPLEKIGEFITELVMKEPKNKRSGIIKPANKKSIGD